MTVHFAGYQLNDARNSLDHVFTVTCHGPRAVETMRRINAACPDTWWTTAGPMPRAPAGAFSFLPDALSGIKT